MKVNYSVNVSSWDASKETIVACLLEKYIMKLYPALAIDADEEDAITQISINDKFWLFSLIFSEELHEKAMMS
jgi:hypothetical protein